MIRNPAGLAEQQFDLLVCGGGIYGAWTAYDATLRGLKVALIEQGDWASGTSSASSKLIHGGLRYLETYDFQLVKKALAERHKLLSIAPHRVWPLRFTIPIYQHSRLSRWQLKAGLTLYDWLAPALPEEMKHRNIGSWDLVNQMPALHNVGLRGGFSYTDAQTDDARLVLELVASAMALGAVCVNYCQLKHVIKQDGVAQSALLESLPDQQELTVHYQQLIVTTGQWLKPHHPDWCRLSKGVHLILPDLAYHEALLLTAPSDGRVFFVIPWYGRTLIGTTDRDFAGDINHVRVEPEDVAYLLQATNAYLNCNWSEQDVIASYAGLRVFKQSKKSSPSAVSRDWELHMDEQGVLYSIGGKITSAREDANQIVSRACAQLNNMVSCETGAHALCWSPQESYPTWLAAKQQKAAQLGIDPQSTAWLIRRHGTHISQIFTLIQQQPSLAQRIVPDVPLIEADLQLCASQEMVVHLDDLLRRRMPLLILAKIDINTLRRIANSVAAILGWHEVRVLEEVVRISKSK